ncbi:unnamed protein product [Trifolium pratense]|uniref:Uncharacterized protein n=1 Tax=Trifolium pratense TaxID=57577 RepID=A0ACB0K1C4_TRIPR|nr:unnamed protein product [Trifolium pratense]
MFRLKNSKNLARFLYQEILHNSNSMAYSIGYVDPCSHLSKVYPNAFGVNRRIEFGRKSCGFYTSCRNNSKFFVRANARPRGFASDLEQGNSVGGDVTLKVDNGGVNGSPAMPRCFRDQRMSEKLVVAVDVDEVLGNFVSALNKFIADKYSSNHSVSEYHVYEFFKIWNCSRDEADIRVHEFFKTPYFKSGIHPLPGAQTAMQKLSRFFNLSVVTYDFGLGRM